MAPRMSVGRPLTGPKVPSGMGVPYFLAGAAVLPTLALAAEQNSMGRSAQGAVVTQRLGGLYCLGNAAALPRLAEAAQQPGSSVQSRDSGSRASYWPDGGDCAWLPRSLAQGTPVAVPKLAGCTSAREAAARGPIRAERVRLRRLRPWVALVQTQVDPTRGEAQFPPVRLLPVRSGPVGCWHTCYLVARAAPAVLGRRHRRRSTTGVLVAVVVPMIPGCWPPPAAVGRQPGMSASQPALVRHCASTRWTRRNLASWAVTWLAGACQG
jgi:hypothetical protein